MRKIKIFITCTWLLFQASLFAESVEVPPICPFYIRWYHTMKRLISVCLLPGEINESRKLIYNSFYVVDTLQFIDPICIYSGNRPYVCERSLINQIKINKNFFERSDVFLTDSGEGLSFAFDSRKTTDYKKYPYPDYKKELVLDFLTLNIYQKKCRLCHLKKINLPDIKLPKKVSAFQYDSDTVVFILGLMHIDSYNKKYTQVMDSGPTSIEGKSIKDKFIKMLFPICIDNSIELIDTYSSNLTKEIDSKNQTVKMGKGTVESDLTEEELKKLRKERIR